ncbi:GlsB/YeaQ/YmgE family stress response membrane protein [Cereibacter sphaeroides]|uniref:GlsB/YeaQ/YmgE family stress response membrane protein n=1 Tax=Cereibacter sphaeroides TaxID=1063 RepID=UPI001F40F3D3|nr:GlsB/YeaQ/YmgE family stress response membrane protein [Cereibacter sphaeroides]MCE6952625.1 GlsB/YeaQ/YmgE family stress response membrane protein [Cereibacter sphaeroides]MCE6959905.1 GlsB/YeaQ/YmgE family stress response membrane protein [Cereibacter sphaeroides]MCE6968474.1 GlsB/YeaQ/YmgE family stress response membrane protein [Cereibacter sphaeroides]MCE6972990.1 GlsB/YeaQ/YmgE family stress response membrane protein [Cereibacter sphaeroides]
MTLFLMLLIVGAAAGFLATRFMRLEADVPTTVAIGMAGAVVGWLVLRVLMALTGALALFVGAVAGAMLVIWLWRRYRA